MNIEWIFDEGDFEAWTQGRTGYPIVDAGVRVLFSYSLLYCRCDCLLNSVVSDEATTEDRLDA